MVLFTERWSEERLGSVHSFDLDWDLKPQTRDVKSESELIEYLELDILRLV